MSSRAFERAGVIAAAMLATLLAAALQVDTITVDLRLAPDLPRLWADPHQLQQVVVNLLTNAQQALRDAELPRQLALTTQWDPGRVVVTLEVTDSGPGIPPVIQARIFEPFFTTKPAGVGSGLGLPLCQGIIESHGGTIATDARQASGGNINLSVGRGSVDFAGGRGESSRRRP